MHIVLGLLGAIVAILASLNLLFIRLADAGIDIKGLNPVLMHRRRKWRKTYEGQPIFKIDEPMELAALLVVGLAKTDGDMSAEEKHSILKMFESEFRISRADASGLMSSCVYLLGRGDEFRDSLDKIIKPSIAKFSGEQLESTMQMLQRIGAQIGGEEGIKQAMLERILKALMKHRKPI